MKINRVWAMPSKHTFTIKPTKELIQRYVGDGKGWIDPFAGFNSPAEITNDLNPEAPTTYHLHCNEFAKNLEGEYEGVLFDPPYSITQVKQCYQSYGCEDFMKQDATHFPYDVKRELAGKIKDGGIAISFGWNSGGFGKKLGFEIIEILLVPHGRMHNDTIVTVERKLPSGTDTPEEGE